MRMYSWTIWSVRPVDEGTYELYVTTIGSGGKGINIKLGHARIACLTEYYKVKEAENLSRKTFESPEGNAVAAIYDFILNILNAPND